MAGPNAKHDVCTLWFCDEPHYGRGLCARHYQNWLRYKHPLPSKAYDLREALRAVERYRVVTQEFLSNGAYLVTMDGEQTVSSKCKYCGAESTYRHTVIHTDDCPVGEAQALLDGTFTDPPEEPFTYEL